MQMFLVAKWEHARQLTHGAGAVGSTVERGGAGRALGRGEREARRKEDGAQDQGLGHIHGRQCTG
jgi:hypothetical protein